MKIAVLMSTYNGSQYLNKQLDSIHKQTITENVTIYIRDDGSTDSTFDIIDKWSKKMQIVLFKETNVGPALSFWKLLMNEEISADYFFFCDQDDEWDSNKIEEQILSMQRGACLSICNCRVIDGSSNVIDVKRVKSEVEISIPRLFVSGVAQGCSMAFTCELRDYLIAIQPKCVPMHDIVLMINALNFGNVVWDDRMLFSYRVHQNNVVANNNKSFFNRMKTTFWNIKNSSKNSMSQVARELLSNAEKLSEQDMVFLHAISKYKGNVRNKHYVLSQLKHMNVEQDCARSFRGKVLLNLL